MTKGKLLSTIAEKTGITKKDAGVMWDTVCEIAAKQLRGTGVVTFPGLIKMTVKDIPAQVERKGKHPFTGEDHVFQAKSASKRLKATIPKVLKDAVLSK